MEPLSAASATDTAPRARTMSSAIPAGRSTGTILALADGRHAACDCCSVGHSGENQDVALVGRASLCVADGIGGAPYGALFARLVAEVAVARADGGASAVDASRAAVGRVCALCADCRVERGGAAFFAAAAAGDGLDCAWLGDVVAFLLHGGVLTRVNEPHRSGVRLARAAGPHPQLPAVTHVALAAGDRLAVLTDGVWERTAPARIARALADAPSPRAATSLLVLGRDLRDDATALTLFV